MNLNKLIEFEGATPHLYLDSVGNVTCGVGHLCKRVEDALAVKGWQHPESVSSDFRALAQFATQGSEWLERHSADWYEQATVARLPLLAIENQAVADAVGSLKLLERTIVHYDVLPIPVQDALLDMAFNLGGRFLERRQPGTGQRVWQNFFSAIVKSDWRTAAEHCHRVGVSAARNDWTRQQFLAAA